MDLVKPLIQDHLEPHDVVCGVWACIAIKNDLNTSIGPFLLNRFVHAIKLSEIAVSNSFEGKIYFFVNFCVV